MQNPASIPSGGATLETTEVSAGTHRGKGMGLPGLSARPPMDEAQRYLEHVRGLLFPLNGRRGMPDPSSVVWPAGLNRQVLAELPLTVRTDNCLRSDQFLDGSGDVTVFELMRIQNFGRKSLKDLLLALERFLITYTQTPQRLPYQATGLVRQACSDVAAATLPSDWDNAASVLRPLLAAAAELKSVQTISDVLSGEIGDLARKMAMSPELESIRVENLVVGTQGPVSITVERLKGTLLAMSTIQQLVVEHRLLQKPPMTLDEVGTLAGVTRERIRQIQVKVERKVTQAMGIEMQLVASVLQEELAPIMREQAFDRQVDAKLEKGASLSERLLRSAVVVEMGYMCQNGMYINEQARLVIAEIRNRVTSLIDDAGLVDEPQLLATLPDEGWHQYWPILRRHIIPHEMHGCLAIRNSAKARAKSALISIGRAATREEIAKVCGLSAIQVAGAFSNIPSVVRASKEEWALKGWVDDEYDGIVGEIIQRIMEDGGSTSTERVLRELPEKFGVSLRSVHAYMQTPKFLIRDGWISQANVSSIKLRPLEDTVHGLDENGAPYWTFAVEPRLFDGYSVLGVPPEFAKALGCEPDGGARLHIENLPLCHDLSMRWRLASTTGASLGYVADALETIGIREGQIVRVTLKGPNRVTLTEHRDPGSRPPKQEADEIIERMKNRRRLL